MTTRLTQLLSTSPIQPASAVLGDEWYNSSTNKLYKYVTVSGNMPTWTEMPIVNSSNVFSVSNVAVSGGTGAFSGSSSALALTTTNVGEAVGYSTSLTPNLINCDLTAQSINFFTVAITSNWTVNFRGSQLIPLNSVLGLTQSITAVVMVTQGTTAYYNNVVMIDGIVVAPKWQGGSAPTSGNTSSIDTYSYTIIKTAASTYTVLASLTKFS
jgi:hypothetical protein